MARAEVGGEWRSLYQTRQRLSLDPGYGPSPEVRRSIRESELAENSQQVRQDDHAANAGYSSALSTLLGDRSKRTLDGYSLQEPPSGSLLRIGKSRGQVLEKAG